MFAGFFCVMVCNTSLTFRKNTPDSNLMALFAALETHDQISKDNEHDLDFAALTARSILLK